MKKIVFLFVFFISSVLYSQFADCSGSVAVCETSTQNYNVAGIGAVNDLPTVPSGCLGDGGSGTGVESNSIWFRFRAARDGQIGFNIIPDNPTDDWDFAVYGPDVACNSLGNPIPGQDGGTICNYQGDNPNDGGMTGAGDPPSGASADWFSPFFIVTAGEEYLLLINSFQGGNDSFTLEWTGRLIDDGGGNPLDCSIVVGNLGADRTVCEGTQVDLDGTATSTTVPIDTYQWQISTDGGTTFTDIAGETNPTISITNNASGVYRVIVTDTDSNTFGDNEDVVITFVDQPTIDPLPATTVQCVDDDFTIAATTTNADTFTWQVSTDGGTTFNNITASANYADFNTATLQINDVPIGFNNNQYQLLASNSAAENTCETTSTVTILTVNPLPTADALTNSTACEGDDFTIAATNITNADTFQWQVSTDGGTTWTDIVVSANYSNVTTDTLQITDVPDTFNNNQYQLVMTNSTTMCSTQTNAATLTVNLLPSANPLSDLTECEDDDFTITAATTNASSFQWQVSTDGGATWNDIIADANYSNVTTATLSIADLPIGFNNNMYRIFLENAGATCDSLSNEITLTVNPIPTATVIADTAQCEEDDFTFTTTTTNADTYQWQVSTDGGTTWTDIVASANYADVTTTTLQINDVPTTFNNNQYRVNMTNSTTTCNSQSNAATLTVNPLPMSNTIADVTQCENDDFTIDVTATNANTYQWQVSTDGGTTWTDIVADVNYSNETTNTLQISDLPIGFDTNMYRVFMENATATCDSFSNEMTLSVNPVPTATFIADTTQCEENDFTFTTTTTNADTYQWQVSTDAGTTWTDIVASANYADVTTTTLQINDVPNSFNNNLYRVNMTNSATTCNSQSNAATLTVNPLPTADALINLTQCENDDFTITVSNVMNADTFQWQVSTDSGTSWSDIIVANANYSGETTNTLSITNAPLTFDDNQYRVVLTNAATTCTDLTNAFTLTINPLPILNTMVELEQCDDDTDGFSDFNLTEANTLLSTNSANETFTYYPTLADANAGINDISNNPADPINVFAYQNPTVATSTIAVRVTDNTTMCFRTTELLLTVSTTQIPSTYSRNFFACDDFLDINGNDNINNDDTDGITSFDFSSVKAEVEAFFVSSGQTVTATFYRTQADALAELNEITDTANYRNIGFPNTQQIYVRVDSDIDNGCLGLGPYVNLTVTPVPVANPINAANEFEECDDLVDGNSTNGISEFNLASLTPTILGSQNLASYSVTYHESAAEATSGANPLPNTYRNTASPFRQTIFVRVAGNGCSFDRYTFDLVVNPLPTANALNMANTLEVCDNDDDGSAINGFVQNIDLELLTPTILGTSQDPANFTVTYHTSLALAQSGATPITGLYTNANAGGDIVYVRIVNDLTTCVNDTFNFRIQVNSEPLGNPNGLLSNLSECDNDTDGDDTNGFIQTFDLESLIPDILGDPTVQDEDDFNVTFHLNQADASSGNDPQSSPFTNTIQGGQTIFVRIENKATGCVNDDIMFDVIVNPLPDFVITTPQIVCLNDTPLTLTAENPAAVYTYEWFDAAGTSLGTDISQDVAVVGEYTVTATTTDGTMCNRSRTITVNESNIATITDADITIVDDSDNNSITINNDNNNLGEGDYEFALANENGVIIRDYQDYNIFEGLEGGIYTIFVRDKNGCGVASLVVPVVEFPKFFTPNGDGIKDTWAIKGVNTTFFPESRIHIFNRQGKVIAEVLVDGPGWNGLYNNAPAPSNDYWFNIQLIDRQGNVRNRKGHFSLLRR